MVHGEDDAVMGARNRRSRVPAEERDPTYYFFRFVMWLTVATMPFVLWVISPWSPYW